MANLIKIKRSSGTAAPASLNEGELAVSFLSGKLFVGNTTAVIPIGGVHSPGTLTANQALVANATSGIDKIIVANLQPTFIYANGASGTDGQILVSNSTGGVYWGASAASALNDLTDVTISSASNNQILLYDSTSSQWQNHSILANSGQINLTFSPCGSRVQLSLLPDVTINSSLIVGNSSVNSVVNSTSVSTSNLAATNAITVGSNVTVNTTSFFVGNSTVNTVVNSASVTASNLAALNTIVVGSEITVNTSSFFVGNSTVNAVVNSSSLSIGNSLINATSVSVGNSSANSIINSTAVSATSLLVGSNVTVNTSSFFVGNSTVNSVVNSTSVTSQSVSTSNLAATNTITVGSNVSINTSTIFVGNSTVNTTIQAGNIALQGTQLTLGSNVVLTDTTLTVGNSSVNAVVNSTSVSTGNLFATNVITVGSNVTINTSALLIPLLNVGNSTVNSVLTSTSLTTNTANVLFVTVGSNVTVNVSSFFVGNSTVNTTIQSANIALGSNVVLNDTSLSIGNSSVNTSINSTSITAINVFSQSVNTVSIYVSNTAEVVGSITARANVTVNGALVVANTAQLGNTTITGFITVGNSTVNSAINSTSVSATSLLVGSNVVVNTSAFFVGNSSVNAVLTATTLDVDGTVTATNGSFVDLSVSGNLTVTGTLTTLDTVNLVVQDPMLKLANGNSSTDLLDVGFYGVYGSGGAKYTGLFRDATDGVYNLFAGTTEEPTTTVNVLNGFYSIATLKAFLNSGGLVSNGTNVAITANSTLAVGITANTLSLSTDLAVEYGGTGVGTFTTRGVIYGNGTSALQVTSAGTDGQVLQANSTGFPVFADLDGGTF